MPHQRGRPRAIRPRRSRSPGAARCSLAMELCAACCPGVLSAPACSSSAAGAGLALGLARRVSHSAGVAPGLPGMRILVCHCRWRGAQSQSSRLAAWRPAPPVVGRQASRTERARSSGGAAALVGQAVQAAAVVQRGHQPVSPPRRSSCRQPAPPVARRCLAARATGHARRRSSRGASASARPRLVSCSRSRSGWWRCALPFR